MVGPMKTNNYLQNIKWTKCAIWNRSAQAPHSTYPRFGSLDAECNERTRLKIFTSHTQILCSKSFLSQSLRKSTICDWLNEHVEKLLPHFFLLNTMERCKKAPISKRTPIKLNKYYNYSSKHQVWLEISMVRKYCKRNSS